MPTPVPTPPEQPRNGVTVHLGHRHGQVTIDGHDISAGHTPAIRLDLRGCAGLGWMPPAGAA